MFLTFFCLRYPTAEALRIPGRCVVDRDIWGCKRIEKMACELIGGDD